MPIYSAYGSVSMNGTIITTNTATVTVTNPLTVQSFTLDSNGITTRATTNDDLHIYSFDRVSSATTYSVYWTGISSSEIDFQIATPGLTDVRTITSAPQIGIVQIDGVNTPFTWTGTTNTILVNAGKAIKEFFALASNGGGNGGGSVLYQPTPVQNTTTPVSAPATVTNNTATISQQTITISNISIDAKQSNQVMEYDANAIVTCNGHNQLTITNMVEQNNFLNLQFPSLPILVTCSDLPMGTNNQIPIVLHLPPQNCDTQISLGCFTGTVYSTGINYFVQGNFGTSMIQTIYQVNMPPYYDPIYVIGIILGIIVAIIIVIKMRYKPSTKRTSMHDSSMPKSKIRQYEEETKRLISKHDKPVKMKKFFKDLDDEFRV